MNRFSKENIDRLVKYPIQYGLTNNLRHFGGMIVDNSGLLGATFLLILSSLGLIYGNLVLILIIALLLIQSVLYYYSYILFSRIKTNRYNIDLGLNKKVKFIFISDLHLGREYTGTKKARLLKIIEELNSKNLDLILFGGDFICKALEPELLSLLSGVKANYKFAVYGNHDAKYLKENIQYNLPTEFINDFKSTGIDLLINQSKVIKLDGVELLIGGIPDLYSKNFNIEETFKGKSGDLKILLSHNPDVIDFVEESDNIDLILSGHNHSGQIFLPVVGPVLPMPTKRRYLTKGIYQINKRTKLLLSQGAGFMGSRLRIGTTPEICEVVVS